MKIKRLEILAPIRRWIIIAVVAVCMILLLFIYMLCQTSQREYKDKLIIHLFGEQKIYTQMISKDVTRIYGLLLAKDTGEMYWSEEELNQKIAGVKHDLSSTFESFANNLADLKGNNISYEGNKVDFLNSILDSSIYLQAIERLWLEFDQSIEEVLQAEQIDSEFIKNVVFINDSNGELLELYNQLQDEFLKITFVLVESHLMFSME